MRFSIWRRTATALVSLVGVQLLDGLGRHQLTRSLLRWGDVKLTQRLWKNPCVFIWPHSFLYEHSHLIQICSGKIISSCFLSWRKNLRAMIVKCYHNSCFYSLSSAHLSNNALPPQCYRDAGDREQCARPNECHSLLYINCPRKAKSISITKSQSPWSLTA